MIQQATKAQTHVIELVLQDAVAWLERKHMPNWRRDDVTWQRLSDDFSPEDFYLYWQDGAPLACMALVDEDPLFWPGIPKGESLYIHKLAARECAQGKATGAALIQFAVEQCRLRGIGTLRLDCRTDRPRLMAYYERQGFRCLEVRRILDRGFDSALCCMDIR